MRVKRKSPKKIAKDRKKIRHENAKRYRIPRTSLNEAASPRKQHDETNEAMKNKKQKKKEMMRIKRSDTIFKILERDQNRKRQQQARMNREYAKRENERDKKRLQNVRKNNEFKRKENATKMRESMKRKRENKAFRKKENDQMREYIKRKRGDLEFRQNELRQNRNRMVVIRKREAYMINERRRNIARNVILRQNIQYVENEIANNVKRNRILRQRKAFKSRELALNVTRNKLLRKHSKYYKDEVSRNIERNKKLRSESMYRKKETEKNQKRIKKIRCRKGYNKRERMLNIQRIKKKRTNERFRARELKKNANFLTEKRAIDVLKFRENFNTFLLRNQDTDPKAKLQLKFLQFRAETASFVCCCCEGLFFRCSVVKLNENKIIGKSSASFLAQINNFPSGFIFNTCKNAAYRGKVYKLSTRPNGLQFIQVPKCVRKLSDLEERMVAPELNFMRIRALKPYALNPQLGLKGSVVNIQVNINDMLQVLPRKFDEMQTIQIKLKRHVDHKSYYMFEAIRPAMICQALNHLITTPLYENYEVNIDEAYLQK